MTTKYEIRKIEHPYPDGSGTATYFELFEIISENGVEKPHRSKEGSWKTRAEAEKWAKKQTKDYVFID